MTKNKHNKDKRLHNSRISDGDRLDLAWQETADLLPEDEVEGGTEIYYFTDENGNAHSRESLAQELIPDDGQDVDGSLQQESITVNAHQLNPSTTDIVNLVRAHEETPRDVSIPLPKPTAGPIDVRISSEVAPDVIAKKAIMQPSDKLAEGKHIIVSFDDKITAQEQAKYSHEPCNIPPASAY